MSLHDDSPVAEITSEEDMTAEVSQMKGTEKNEE